MTAFPITIDTIRPSPTSLQEASSQACVLLRQCQADHPYLTPILATLAKVNNVAIDFFRKHPLLMTPGNHPVLLAGMAIFTSLFSMYGVAVCISYYVLYLLASELQKKLPVLGRYAQEMNQLIAQTEALVSSSFAISRERAFLKKWSTLSLEERAQVFPGQNLNEVAYDIQASQLFFEVVLQTIFKNMETRPLKLRFLYEVCNQENKVTGYLIGTMHHHTWQVAHDPVFFKTVERCGLFFSEILREEMSTKVDLLWGINPYRYLVDAHLSEHAYKKGIISKKLDTPAVLAQAKAAQEQFEKDKAEGERRLKKVWNDLLELCGEILALEELSLHRRYSYLEGDEGKQSRWEEIFSTTNISCRERTLGWLNGEPQLLARLKGEFVEQGTDPKKPICVVAGIYHMIGDQGLASLLQKEGLTVTRLSQGPAS